MKRVEVAHLRVLDLHDSVFMTPFKPRINRWHVSFAVTNNTIQHTQFSEY